MLWSDHASGQNPGEHHITQSLPRSAAATGNPRGPVATGIALYNSRQAHSTQHQLPAPCCRCQQCSTCNLLSGAPKQSSLAHPLQAAPHTHSQGEAAGLQAMAQMWAHMGPSQFFHSLCCGPNGPPTHDTLSHTCTMLMHWQAAAPAPGAPQHPCRQAGRSHTASPR